MAQHIYRPTEPYYDPTDEMDAALDADRVSSTDNPVAYLDHLMARNDIGRDERDAGDILLAMAAKARMPGGTAAAMVNYPTRDAAGAWSTARCTRAALEAKVKAALAAIRSDRRRREVDRFICRDELADTTAQLSFGLEDVARHFWPVTRATHQRNGVTLAGEGPQPQRVTQVPLETLFARRVITDIQHAAGQRYYSDWYHSGLSGIGGIDYSASNGSGAGSAPHMMPLTGLMAIKRADHRKARAALTEQQRRLMEAVVLEERSFTEAAKDATGVGRKAEALRIGGQVLRSALDVLAAQYGLVATRRAA